VSAVLALCFTASGAAALALELLWMRSAGLILGATAPTVATVLACYFAGLGLGAAAASRPSARPVRRYALLELGAAAATLWSVAVLRTLALPAAQRVLAASGSAARVGAVGVAVLPATICLGATLPAIGDALVLPGTVGWRGGLLYALNTLGGALGIGAMGFGLPAAIGVPASYGIATVTSALAGMLALAVGESGTAARPAVREPGRPARLHAVAAGAGAVGLALEVLWTRLFAQVLHNSVYSFATVSLVFLVALASGAALGAVILRRVSGASVAATSLVAAALATISGVWIFVRATDGLAYVGMRTGLAEYVMRIVGIAAATAGPAALASGAVLPALWAAYGDRSGAARPIGELAAVNALGAVVGALTAAFVVLPTVGLRGGFFLAAATYLVLAEALEPGRGALRALAGAALLAIVLADPARAPITHLAAGETLRAEGEGASGIVTVVDTGEDLQLRLDNYYVLGGSAAARNERRQGLVPLLLHPRPRRAAFIGMATGITASAAAALGVDETTVVELVPEVAAAARVHFGAWNGALLDRPAVRLIVEDGRRWLAATADRFDVVVSDLFIPWHAGAGNLYAREMYEAAAARLAPGGLFCQWLPLYQLTREEFDIIVRTFLAVFPHVSLWRDDFYPNRPVVALVGGGDHAGPDLTSVGARLAALPDWAQDPLLATPHGLAMLYLGELPALREVIPPGPLNSDDRPLIEFLAPRLTRINSAGDKDWFTGNAFAAFADALAARASTGSPDLDVARAAGAALYRYALAVERHDQAEAARLEADVRRLVPDVIANAQAPVATLADARRTLSALRDEQEHVRHALDAMRRRLESLGDASGAPP